MDNFQVVFLVALLASDPLVSMSNASNSTSAFKSHENTTSLETAPLTSSTIIINNSTSTVTGKVNLHSSSSFNSNASHGMTTYTPTPNIDSTVSSVSNTDLTLNMSSVSNINRTDAASTSKAFGNDKTMFSLLSWSTTYIKTSLNTASSSSTLLPSFSSSSIAESPNVASTQLTEVKSSKPTTIPVSSSSSKLVEALNKTTSSLSTTTSSLRTTISSTSTSRKISSVIAVSSNSSTSVADLSSIGISAFITSSSTIPSNVSLAVKESSSSKTISSSSLSSSSASTKRLLNYTTTSTRTDVGSSTSRVSPMTSKESQIASSTHQQTSRQISDSVTTSTPLLQTTSKHISSTPNSQSTVIPETSSSMLASTSSQSYVIPETSSSMLASISSQSALIHKASSETSRGLTEITTKFIPTSSSFVAQATSPTASIPTRGTSTHSLGKSDVVNAKSSSGYFMTKLATTTTTTYDVLSSIISSPSSLVIVQSSSVYVPGSGEGSKGKSLSEMTIIFISAGSAVVLLLLILLVCILCRKKRRDKNKAKRSSTHKEDQEMSQLQGDVKTDWGLKWATMRREDPFNKRSKGNGVGLYGEENNGFLNEKDDEKQANANGMLNLSNNDDKSIDGDEFGSMPDKIDRCRTFSSAGLEAKIPRRPSLLEMMKKRRDDNEADNEIPPPPPPPPEDENGGTSIDRISNGGDEDNTKSLSSFKSEGVLTARSETDSVVAVDPIGDDNKEGGVFDNNTDFPPPENLDEVFDAGNEGVNIEGGKTQDFDC